MANTGDTTPERIELEPPVPMDRPLALPRDFLDMVGPDYDAWMALHLAPTTTNRAFALGQGAVQYTAIEQGVIPRNGIIVMNDPDAGPKHKKR